MGSRLGGLPTIPVLTMHHAQIQINDFTLDTGHPVDVTNCACVPHNMQGNKIGRGIENVTENRDVFNAVSVMYTYEVLCTKQ